MFNFEENALITISPGFPALRVARLNFDGRCTPRSRLSFHRKTVLGSTLSEAAENSPLISIMDMIGKHRQYWWRPDRPACSKVGRYRDFIITRDKNVSREYLQSVVVFVEDRHHSSVSDAFKAAETKIKDCFDFLAEYLGQLQRSLPYLSLGLCILYLYLMWE